ncbi:metal ABC transporter substrate-binding protein [Salinibacterium sp. ZJ454]|uniref:metal ABC transporter substrate-binding protein n=1 Tax=Salinibacterium sp. ZJ454 TaxID=2708339 RepID=UPI001423120F|nr:metal ABC transporter substrate-binding protein [Salinibacterium sp. ZJ454]
MNSRVLPLVGLAAAAVTVLAGCAGSDGAAGDASTTGISIVATTTQMADFTRQVAGDAATVTQLLQPNTSAHSFDPAPVNLLELAEADALVMNGAGLEGWLGGAVLASGFDGVTIDASRGIELLGGTHDDAEHADETADQHAEHADEVAEEHTADDGHDHAEEPTGDPHIWTSIRNAIVIVDDIAHQLAELDPANADSYTANAAAYTERLAALDTWATAQIDRVPAAQRLLVTNHESVSYLVADYGITYVGAVLPSFDDNAELSASDIADLAAKIKATGATAVYSEASLSPKSAEAIAREAGVRVFTGEEALYVDSLGPAGSPASTYLGAQLHNISQILLGWGVTPDPAPTSVTE